MRRIADGYAADIQRCRGDDVERQRVSQRGGKGRYGPPIHERVEIKWAGHDDFDTTVWERGARERELAAKLMAH